MRPDAVASSSAWLIAAFLLVVVEHLLAAPALASEWQVVSNKEGLLIERRRPEGSPYYEVRATTQSSLSPVAIFNTIWRQQEYPQFVPYLKRLDLLSETGDERVAYEQVAIPLAKDRDYTVRLQRRVDADAQRYEIVFVTANDAGPPPDNDHVRVSSIRGRWLVELGPEGKGSTVRYEVLNEPGGAIPAWVVNQVQGEAVATLVRAMLQRTREKASRK